MRLHVVIDMAHSTLAACKEIAGSSIVAFLSGNNSFWQVVLEDNGDTMVPFKDSAWRHHPLRHSQPELLTGKWLDPIIDQPEPTAFDPPTRSDASAEMSSSSCSIPYPAQVTSSPSCAVSNVKLVARSR